MRATLQLIARVFLGAVLLPVICLAALVISFLAACSDKGLLLRKSSRRHKWLVSEYEWSGHKVP